MLAVQPLCTRVKAPMIDDEHKLECVLGCLKLTKNWTRSFDDCPFECIEMYIDMSFTTHNDGQSQYACMVMLGSTLVHEACSK